MRSFSSMNGKFPFPVPEWMDDEGKAAALRFYPLEFIEQLSEHYNQSVSLGAPLQPQERESRFIEYDFSFPIRTLDGKQLGIYRCASFKMPATENITEHTKTPEFQSIRFSYEGIHPLAQVNEKIQLEAKLLASTYRWLLDENHPEIIFPGIKGQPVIIQRTTEEMRETTAAHINR